MGIDVIADQTPQEQDSLLTPVPQTPWGKLLYGLFIVVMPILAFWVTDLFKPEWQTGKFPDYLILLLFPESSLLFFLLLTYSIVCYWLFLIDTARYSQLFMVRLGVYTGILLALQYSVLLALYFYTSATSSWSALFLVVLWALPVFVPNLYRWLVKKWGATAIHAIFLGLVTLFFLISSVLMHSPLYPLILVLAGLTVAAPFWCFLIMLRAANWSLKRYGPKITMPQGLGLVAWLAGYTAAWRFDVLKMYELYAALPPQPPPDCYVATAAAQGHPWLVGSWLVEHQSGEMIRVNQQLQVLKCAELAILATQPHLHKRLRRIYDVVGRSLARQIRNPWLADLAYLLLKPCDVLSRWMLRILVPEIDGIVQKLYTS